MGRVGDSQITRKPKQEIREMGAEFKDPYELWGCKTFYFQFFWTKLKNSYILYLHLVDILVSHGSTTWNNLQSILTELIFSILNQIDIIPAFLVFQETIPHYYKKLKEFRSMNIYQLDDITTHNH